MYTESRLLTDIKTYKFMIENIEDEILLFESERKDTPFPIMNVGHKIWLDDKKYEIVNVEHSLTDKKNVANTELLFTTYHVKPVKKHHKF
ncbi:hypothetical protein ABES36_14335 [Bacillus pseudomycoides]|uniref:hypothetical protein n=1 Tax=Bacillus pseudomycoides TaxID=64104 RepID=UPI003D1E3917